MKKSLLFLSAIIFMAINSFTTLAQTKVIINEFSQGDLSSNHDWIELIVTANGQDLRGLYITTRAAYGGYPSTGSSTVDLTKGIELSKTNTDLNNLDIGTIIVIYRAGAKNSTLTDHFNIADGYICIPSDDGAFMESGGTWAPLTIWDGVTNASNAILLYSSNVNNDVLTGIFCVQYGISSSATTEFDGGGYGDVILPSTTTFDSGQSIYWSGTDPTTDALIPGNWIEQADASASPTTQNPGQSILPVELTSFSGSVVNNSVYLTWETATEVNNYGFDIERSSGNEGWQKIGFVAGSGNSNSPKNYSFTDTPSEGTSFSYRLKQIDVDGNSKYYDAVTVNLTASSEAQLLQNNPNPFNPSTTIKFYTPNTSDVTIRIYDMLGREVTTLINQKTTAGYHVVYWNGKDSRGEEVSSGVYLYRLTAGNFSETKKMNLLK
ncbi:MAG TPA: T9SS type A sorting domain-containing protein [Ignavibacteriaceae bacterium]|nr:T9SS type A sorting domain-containing protein [Ignavibacteriaceae bacterium]